VVFSSRRRLCPSVSHARGLGVDALMAVASEMTFPTACRISSCCAVEYPPIGCQVEVRRTANRFFPRQFIALSLGGIER
jgi:hypothetical protein